MKTHLLCLVLVTATFPVFGQTRNSAIKPSTPTTRFIITGQATVIDKQTGLEWTRCAAYRTWDGANCAGSVLTRGWQEALNLAEASTFAGHEDWRLPNLKELMSIVEVACYYPSINERVFLDAERSKVFWSSTSFTLDPTQAYAVDFWEGGYDRNGRKDWDYFGLRLVRRALPAPVAP